MFGVRWRLVRVIGDHLDRSFQRHRRRDVVAGLHTTPTAPVLVVFGLPGPHDARAVLGVAVHPPEVAPTRPNAGGAKLGAPADRHRAVGEDDALVLHLARTNRRALLHVVGRRVRAETLKRPHEVTSTIICLPSTPMNRNRSRGADSNSRSPSSRSVTDTVRRMRRKARLLKDSAISSRRSAVMVFNGA